MAVPVHLFLKDDGGAMIRGGSDVADREGSIELRDLIHNLSIPTDDATGKLTAPKDAATVYADARTAGRRRLRLNNTEAIEAMTPIHSATWTAC
ncbi:hypothetical protein L1887_45656 [Cichorium endivia]|nr:hypothetical protein L1887_45656 [Cichorium endivia]